MQLAFTRLASLPKLAWCAHLAPGGDRLSVQAGAWVDAGDDWFFEGAWDGSFTGGRFDRARTRLGSGARIEGDSVAFHPASHVLERLYATETDHGTFVSNSLPFLLAASGVQLRPRYRRYVPDLLSILEGLDRYRRCLPAEGGREIRQHYFATLRLGRDGSLSEEEPPLRDAPADFEALRALYAATSRRIADNLAHPDRQKQFTPFITLSSGYDTAACAVFAREIGCTRAVTFADARDGSNDSGAPIGEALGMEVEERGRLDYRRRDDIPDDKYLVSGSIEDLPMASLDDDLCGTLYVSGMYGDRAWTRTTKGPGSIGRRLVTGPDGLTFQEARLEVGYVLFPLPLIAARHQPELIAISNSEAMAPWSVGGSYDRPIPRRIAEEAGVPREAFGRTKRAVTQSSGAFRSGLADALTPGALESLRAFRASWPFEPGALRRTGYAVGSFLEHLTYEARLRLQRLRHGASPPYPLVRLVQRRLRYGPMLGTTAFYWAAERLVGRYRDALGAPDRRL